MGILGIDVAKDQGPITWPAVAGDGISFAYIKATEGLQTDSGHEARVAYFRANWARAGAAGLPRGAYHFFRPDEDGQQQADIFLQLLETVETAELPPMVDVEFEKNVPTVDRATFVSRLTTFLTEVKGALGVHSFVYTNISFWNANLDASFGDYPLWIANYGEDRPTGPVAPAPRGLSLPTGFDDFVLWQFTENGNVAGVSTASVDLNFFRGTIEELLQLGAPSTLITVTVNGVAVPDAAGFLDKSGFSFGWIRPISVAIDATIVDFSTNSVTLERGGHTATIPSQVLNNRAFVHLAELERLLGVTVAFEPLTQTVAIVAA